MKTIKMFPLIEFKKFCQTQHTTQLTRTTPKYASAHGLWLEAEVN